MHPKSQRKLRHHHVAVWKTPAAVAFHTQTQPGNTQRPCCQPAQSRWRIWCSPALGHVFTFRRSISVRNVSSQSRWNKQIGVFAQCGGPLKFGEWVEGQGLSHLYLEPELFFIRAHVDSNDPLHICRDGPIIPNRPNTIKYYKYTLDTLV